MNTKKLSLALVLVILISSFLTLASGASSSNSYASDKYSEGIFTYRIWDGEAVIVGCDPSANGELVIPEKLGGFPVTAISDTAFANCSGITDIVFHSGIDKIGVEVPAIEMVDIPLETYYGLYVQDSLLYHMNFASATEDMAVTSDKPNAEYASDKFGAVTSTYEPFLVGMKQGITNPWKGGTATVSEGGWKFISPYRYEYWFKEDGSLKNTGGSTATFDNFVTEEGLAGVSYYMPSGAYVKAEAGRTIGGVTKPLYQLVHQAPDNATGYYIAAGVWGGAFYSSSFGNGYFDASKGNDIKPYNGEVKNALAAADAFTVELTAASTKLKNAAFFIGPRFEFSPKADVVNFTGSVGEMLADGSGYKTISMALKGAEINTYSFTFDMSDIANYKYTLNAYGNGTNYSTQNLVSKTNAFSASGQYVMRDNGLHTYAMRVYEKELSANEVLQNHFADVALIARLDVTEFLALDGEEKLSVYKAFKETTPDMNRTELQILLNDTIRQFNPAETTVLPQTTAPAETTAPELPAAPVSPFKDYYDLYVQDELLMHLNFAEASEYTPDIVGGANYLSTETSAVSRFDGAASNYTPFLVYSSSKNPVKGGTAKIIAPWFHKNWYVNGYFNNNDRGNGTNLQYDEPLEYDEIGTRNGKNVYVRYTNQYTEEYYISDGTWANKIYASKWSKGSIMLGKNNSLYYSPGNEFEGGTGYTFNFSVKSAEGTSYKTYMGPRYNISKSGNSMQLTVEASGSSLIPSSNEFKTVQMPDANAKGINNFSMQVDVSDLKNSKVTVGFAANGVSYANQTVTSRDEVETLRQLFCNGDGVYIYAIRSYGKVLSEIEIMQNNFADIATVNKLDISAFKTLAPDQKAEVYKAFSGKTSDTDKAELQSILDAKIAELGVGTVLSETVPDGASAPAETVAVAMAPVTDAPAVMTLAATEVNTFAGCTALKTITVLSPVCEFYSAAFGLADTVKVYGYAPSTAEEYANTNGNTFIDLNDDETNGYYAGAFADGKLVFSLEKATGALKISGNGKMPDYTQTEKAPWHDYSSAIRSIIFGDGVESVGSYAFAECYNLTGVRFSSALSRIGDNAFAKTGIERVSIPVGVTEIGKDAFYLCNLKKIDVNSSNSVYLSKNNCLIEIATGTLLIGSEKSIIPTDGSVVRIADRAFAGRSGLTEIFIPEFITKIGTEVFDACTALESIEVHRSNQFFRSIDNCLIDTGSATLIYGCKNSVIPTDDCVAKIGNGAFSSCIGLTEIEIPNTIVEIGSRAFFGCVGLEALQIPSSVTAIGSEAFKNASGLKEVAMLSAQPPVLSDDAFDGCEALDNIFVPEDSVDAYKNAFGWSDVAGLILAQCEHSFVKELALDDYLKSEASCTSKALYYKSCECGKSSEGTEFEETFEYGTVTEHKYDCEKPSALYRASKATAANSAVYYKSCICGKKGTETFNYGDKLPSSNGAVIYIDRVKVFPDSIFTVNVNIKNNPGMAFLSITLNYDKSVMELVKVENGEVLSVLDSGRNLAWSADGNCSDDGVLATLTFELKEGVDCIDSVVGATLNEAYNADCDLLDIALFDGIVFVDDILYGDVNGSGAVDLTDVLLLRKYMANYNYSTNESSVSVKAGANVNGDGLTNLTDVLLLRKYMANYDYNTKTSSVVLGP